MWRVFCLIFLYQCTSFFFVHVAGMKYVYRRDIKLTHLEMLQPKNGIFELNKSKNDWTLILQKELGSTGGVPLDYSYYLQTDDGGYSGFDQLCDKFFNSNLPVQHTEPPRIRSAIAELLGLHRLTLHDGQKFYQPHLCPIWPQTFPVAKSHTAFIPDNGVQYTNVECGIAHVEVTFFSDSAPRKAIAEMNFSYNTTGGKCEQK